LPKSTSKSELARSIERVLSGSISVPSNFVIQNEQGSANLTEALRARLAELTPQQLRVLELIRRGFQNKHIAVELKLDRQGPCHRDFA
jgi:DNA-binding NarL/FixJ family response regulator